MPTATDVLADGGITNPAQVVAAAQTAGLEIATAVAVLVKESSGGKNIWGRDGVPTGGAYTKGGPVTQANYAAYRVALAAGTAGRNGCGPTQLTYGPLQDLADTRGGCWRWDVNVAVGFEHLADLVEKYGVEGGFRAYNGGTKAARAGTVPEADTYGRLAMGVRGTWLARLAGTSPALPPEPSTGGSPAGVLTYGMTNNPRVADLQNLFLRVFPGYQSVKKLAAVGTTGNYFGLTQACVLEFQTRAKVRNADGSAPDGRTVGANTSKALAPYDWR